jgi:hypothetical protein
MFFIVARIVPAFNILNDASWPLLIFGLAKLLVHAIDFRSRGASRLTAACCFTKSPNSL